MSQLTLLSEDCRRAAQCGGHAALVERARRHALSGMRLPPGEASDLWRTPPWLVRAVRLAFDGIDLDAACDSHNVVSDVRGAMAQVQPGLMHDLGDDALTDSWQHAIEKWFDDPSWQRARRASFHPSAINRWVAWCNPPYGDALPRFVERAVAVRQSQAVEPVILCPPRVGTQWWYDHVVRTGANVLFLAGGRLAFLDVLGVPVKNNSADSCLIHWVRQPDVPPWRQWVPIDELFELARLNDAEALQRIIVGGVLP